MSGTSQSTSTPRRPISRGGDQIATVADLVAAKVLPDIKAILETWLTHYTDCDCATCLTGWAAMGFDFYERNYGAFGELRVNAEQKRLNLEVTRCPDLRAPLACMNRGEVP